MTEHVLSKARAYAEEVHLEEVSLLKELAVIPAPSGQEDLRVAFIADWLLKAGCKNVQVDEAKNVICTLGPSDAPELDVFSAHTDVVFDDLTPLPLEEKSGLLYAPGIGDDTACLTGLLMATRYVAQHPKILEDRSRGMLVVANSCEEGLGNLRGTRTLYKSYGARIRSHITFDTYLGHVVTSAVGSHRWRISCDCAGGHSWKDFGNPNAIVELSHLIDRLAKLELPTEARTTYNVGTIEGGSTVNSIAEHAHMLFEYRSTSEACLQYMKDAVVTAVRDAQHEGANFSLESVGERPGNGAVDVRELSLLKTRLCNAVYAVTGAKADCHPSSTDANIPLSMGIPAACVGSVCGAAAHTRGEWIDPTSLIVGLTLTLYLMLNDE